MDGVGVDPMKVIDSLGKTIASLTVENAMLKTALAESRNTEAQQS